MPATSFLETPIEFLKGVGPQRGEVLRGELGIATFGDLLLHVPFRYVDRSRFHTVREASPDLPNVQLRGVLGDLRTVGEKRGRRLVARLTDDTGSIERCANVVAHRCGRRIHEGDLGAGRFPQEQCQRSRRSPVFEISDQRDLQIVDASQFVPDRV